ncbi:MAG: ABC transporter ATP-binding protein [Candidatus Atribacteria bacterium]|nr:ABC transporter ATP-binding protein [Candidatus Atribacteria bacterium]
MFKKFIHYYKPYKGIFFIDLLSATIIAAIDLVFPAITRLFINNIIPENQFRLFYIYIGVLVILSIIRTIANYVVNFWGHAMGTRMERDMRTDIFTHLQTLSLDYFDNVKTGHLMSRVINDISNIGELAHHGPEDLFLSFIMIVGSFIILFRIEWRLTIVLYSFLIILMGYTVYKRKKMTAVYRLVRKKIANVNAQLENSISGIRVAKAFTNEEYELEKFDMGNQEFNQSREMAYKVMAEFYSTIMFLLGFLDIIALGLGGYLVFQKVINIGDLVAYLLYISFFLQPIRRLTNFTEQLQEGISGFERLVEIMSIKPTIIDKEDAVELNSVSGRIEFKNVSFSYKKEEVVLSDINLTINTGQTLALVGPSGAGKTTLCHLIPRFYEINSGEILIDGINIQDITMYSLRKNIGLVQQDVFLFTGTIGENILYGKPDANEEEVIQAAIDANIDDFIQTLPDKYDTYVGEKGVMLSGGQKQRISLARAFLKNPPILILDEATSSLDAETEAIIQESLEKLVIGRTVLVIAHRLSTIRNADQIIVLTNKGIIEKGTHEELLANDKLYSKLYQSQFKGFIPDEVQKNNN